MQAGDRVMVFDSPGFPVDHYLYAIVLTPSDAGALVVIDHPGNLSHNTQKFVPVDRILRAGDASDLADHLRERAKQETEPGRKRHLLDHVAGMEQIAEVLAK